MNRSIVVTLLGARLCQPSKTVPDLLTCLLQRAFRKEDAKPVIDAKGRRVIH